MSDAVEAYAARDRIHWADDLDGAIERLVSRWGEDFALDPDTPKFAYCATNIVANGLNNRLQGIRFAGRLDFQEFTCVRGKIRLFPEDRVQFHATDKKLGISNGAAGKVVSMAADEIVVESDAGTMITFDPAAFDGWGLGYAGTIYRGQGQTLPRTYALYDRARAWSRRSAYVAMTRHRKGFDLFVPKSLARDLGQLGRQMSRGDDCEAALTYATRDEAALLFPKAVIKAAQERGAPREVAAGEVIPAALADHWRLTPHWRFARDYTALKNAAAVASAYSPIHAHFKGANEAALERGILPGTGYRDPRCLTDFLPRNHRADPELAPGKGGFDVSPIVVDIENLEYGAWFGILRRLRQLDHHVLEAIKNQLDMIAAGIANVMAKADLLSDLVVARHFVRVAALLKRRNPDGTLRLTRTRRDFQHLRSLNPVSRQTRGRFHLYRKHPVEGSILADVLGFVSARARRDAVTRNIAKNAPAKNAPNPAPQRSMPTPIPPRPQTPPVAGPAAPAARPAATPPQRPVSPVVPSLRPRMSPAPKNVPPAAPRPATPPPQRPAVPPSNDAPLPKPTTTPPPRKRDDGPAL
jgi:hypothetical protein